MSGNPALSHNISASAIGTAAGVAGGKFFAIHKAEFLVMPATLDSNLDFEGTLSIASDSNNGVIGGTYVDYGRANEARGFGAKFGLEGVVVVSTSTQTIATIGGNKNNHYISRWLVEGFIG